MHVKDIMSTPVVTVEMDDRLAELKHIFDNTRFHHLLVVDEGVLVGVISDRDLLRNVSPYVDTPSEGHRDLATLNKRAHQIMSRKLITVDREAEVVEAIHLFNANTISCIPVVDERRRPVGIVSWRDVLRNLPIDALRPAG